MSFVAEMVCQITGTDCKSMEAYVTSQLTHHKYSQQMEYAAVSAYWDTATDAMQADVLKTFGLDGGCDGVAGEIYFPRMLKRSFQVIITDIEKMLDTSEVDFSSV